MPMYDYQCQECGHAFAVFATFKQKEAGLEPECPQCHSKETQQNFRSVMFFRRGEGIASMPAGCGPNAGPGCCG